MENNQLNSPDTFTNAQRYKGNEITVNKQINPAFSDVLNVLNPDTIKNELNELRKPSETANHSDILHKLLEQIEPVDFREIVFNENGNNETNTENLKLSNKHYLVESINQIGAIAKRNKWALCVNNGFIYVYNGAYWKVIGAEEFKIFLGEAAEKMKVPKYDARLYDFRDKLLKQFHATQFLPRPEYNNDIVLINLKNGTFEINLKGEKLRPFDRTDFLTYQLPFEYDPNAKAPKFEAFIDRVLPDIESRKVLAEFIGYLFIRNGGKRLKAEKVLVLYGSGANGKSVFYEIIKAMLGKENVSSYTIQQLTDKSGYYAAEIINKIVNYSSEISINLETNTFKQMASGEDISVRSPYGRPFTTNQYAKLIFNCNQLPKDVEHTNAYFRRFLIIPFNVTIPENEQDPNLHTKIIENELAGVFNWALNGLRRLLNQGRFTECTAVREAVEQYKIESSSIQMFLNENGYTKSNTERKLLSEFYTEYRSYSNENGYKPFQKNNFSKQLRELGFLVERGTANQMFVYVESSFDPFIDQ
ncbi:MAG: DNA primase [Bacteroidales bacterium]|nr:DNA primase [Bacteroidales bacterium]